MPRAAARDLAGSTRRATGRRRPTSGRRATRRSSGATSSIAAATSRARSRTLRAAIAVAAPLTGVERDPYVPSPYGVVSVSPWTTSTSSTRQPELVRDDLRERRLVALALGLHADRELRGAGGRHAQRRAVVHRQPEHVHVLARAGADGLGEEGDADPHQLAALALARPARRRSAS